MKQIFEWLRKEVESKSVECGGTYIIGMYRVRSLINDAEIKWEADCCEWKRGSESENKDTIFAPHEEVYAMYEICLAMYPYCPICGKRIKISEVE